MKKLFTVLAVLLVASLAFAGFSGSIKAGYTFDFDARDIDYVSAKKVDGAGANYDVTFAWDSQNLTIGEADGTHVEVAAHAGFEGWYLLNDDHSPDYDPIVAGKGEWVYKFPTNASSSVTIEEDTYPVDVPVFNSKYFEAGVKLKLTTFKIVGNNWEVSFINDLGLDFAKSAIDSEEFNKYKLEYNEAFYSMDNSLKAHDLKVTAFGYQFGFGVGATDWTHSVKFALTAVTPDYTFGDVTLKAGAGYKVADEIWQLAGSVKAAYATDKFSVSGAYDALKVADKDYITNDLAVKFDLAPVTVDVYFVNDDAVAKDKYYDYMVRNLADHKHALDISNYLSTQVVVDVARVAENVPVKVTLNAADLLNEESQIVSVKAETTIVPNFKFGVYFKDWFAFGDSNPRKLGATVEFTGVQNLTLNGEVAYRFADEDRTDLKKLFLLAGAEYAHELFTASASVALEKVYKQDAVLGAIVGAKSTTLVKGAELSAKAYFNLNNLNILDTDDDNKLSLACKVSF